MNKNDIKELVSQGTLYHDWAILTPPVFPLPVLDDTEISFAFDPEKTSIDTVADVILDWLASPLTLRRKIEERLFLIFSNYAAGTFPDRQEYLDFVSHELGPDWPFHGAKAPVTAKGIWDLVQFAHVFIQTPTVAHIWGGLDSMAWNDDDELWVVVESGRELLDVHMV